MADDGAASDVRRVVHLLPSVLRGLRRPVHTGDSPLARLGPRHRSALALVEEGALSIGSLASALGLTLPTTSGVIADLEAVGFVHRSPDPADRRRTLVALPREGGVRAREWLDGSTAPIARALGHLTPPERRAFVTALEHLDVELRQPSRPR